MTNIEGVPAKKGLKKWQVVALVLVALVAIGQFSGGGGSSEESSKAPVVTTAPEPTVDIFTKRACRKFREFAAEGGKGVLTISEMRASFKVSYEAAQFSEIPAIVDSATRTMASLTSEDVDAFSVATKDLTDACFAAGQ